MAVWRDWVIWVVVGLAVLTTPLEIYIVLRARNRIPGALAASALQTLERRMAAGEISPEEFQYERQLLEERR